MLILANLIAISPLSSKDAREDREIKAFVQVMAPVHQPGPFRLICITLKKSKNFRHITEESPG